MQRQLVLMRHGHAVESRDDYPRRLSEAGRKAARRAGLALARAGFIPERILTSPAPRALETAELVAETCAYTGDIQLEPELYLTEEGPYLAALHRLPVELARVVLVGHNPTLSVLARKLGHPGGELRPAEYAQLGLALDTWHEL